VRWLVDEDKEMKTRVIIEYVLPPGDRVAIRDREEQRWITSETVLALPGSATVKVELLDGPLMPAVAPKPARLFPATLSAPGRLQAP
jgi:hypothetical protein